MKKKERQKNHPKLPNSDNLLKQAQEKLQESEERYKSLFDRSLDLVYLHDFQSRFLDANDAALKRLGYTKEEIHSLNFASFLSEDQIPIAIKSTEILLAGTQKGLTEYRLKHKDGSDVYVETRGSIVMSKGKPVAIQAIARDITERKKAEAALKEAESKLRTIFDSAADGMLLAKISDRQFSTANKKMGQMLGYTEEELLQMRVDDIHPPESLPYVMDQFTKQVNQSITIARDIPVLRKNGSVFFADVSAAPMNVNGEKCMLGMFRDITDRKKAEEALRQREEELSIKSRNLEEMNAALKVLLKQREDDRWQMEENVLTNVKTSIIPYLEKLKKGTLSKQQKIYLKMIEDQISKIIAPFLRSLSQSSFDLTPQELRVADMVKNGHTTKDIADVLKISTKTVDYHRDNLRRKLGIRNQKTNLRSFLLKFT
ncbi:MAG TPA: PAS domain S-box protein [Smithella sp.]|nr:PAS domain S-box protein [Smithella sp.]HOG89303.1 PAS domain S-box protein [Smithella sp.]